jgi:N-acetylglutamate synthase-like GNAT family acetyltransferase
MSQDFQVRRATLEDLPALGDLWRSMHFETQDLERRLTEFQVAVSPEGQLLGTIAFEVSGRQGRMHSEAFTDFALADALRHAFWQRIQLLSLNYGVVRVWTQETVPYWRQCGLDAPPPEKMDKLPAAWAGIPGAWLTTQLRDEDAVEHALDKEFVRFKEMEKAAGQSLIRPVKAMNTLATWLAFIIAFLVIAAALYVLSHRELLSGPRP